SIIRSSAHIKRFYHRNAGIDHVIDISESTGKSILVEDSEICISALHWGHGIRVANANLTVRNCDFYRLPGGEPEGVGMGIFGITISGTGTYLILNNRFLSIWNGVNLYSD